MLYVTTRNDQEVYTAQHVLTQEWNDSSLYLPFRFPKLSDDLNKLREASFNQRIASLLNMFFSTKLSGWDIDFTVGRYPVRLADLSHRIILAEFWHNLQWKYDYLEKRLAELLPCERTESDSWTQIAIRMAILGSAILERNESKSDKVDIAAASGDFSLSISAWYLRKMGFPIGNVICCCADNNQLWELSCLGQMKTDWDLPVNLERLVHDCGGQREAAQYASVCETGGIYSASEETLRNLRSGLYVSVVSGDRQKTIIPNVFRTYDYILSSESALTYSGLMDYRTKTGITRPVLVVSDYSPTCEADSIPQLMNITQEEFLRMI